MYGLTLKLKLRICQRCYVVVEGEREGGMPAPLFYSQNDKYSVHQSAAITENPDPTGLSNTVRCCQCQVLTDLQQLSAPSGSTSGPRQCQNTPWYGHWEFLFLTFSSGTGASVRVNRVQRLPPGRCPPRLHGFIQKHAKSGLSMRAMQKNIWKINIQQFDCAEKKLNSHSSSKTH